MSVWTKIRSGFEGNLKNPKIVFIASGLIFVSWILKIYFLPMTSTDGPWSLSPVFSYMRGETGWSIFGHEQVGQLFYLTPVYSFFSFLFKIFGLSTFGFFEIGLVFTALTWILLQLTLQTKNHWAIQLALLGYLCSIYTYGFRLETYTLFFSAVLFFISEKTKSNNWINGLVWGGLVFCIGLFHPMGGIVMGMLLLHQWVELRFSWKYLLSVGIACLIVLSWIGLDPILMFLKMNSSIQSDNQNHFDRFYFEHFGKFFLEGNSLVIVLFFAFQYLFVAQKKWWHFIISCLVVLLLLTSGRTYYFPYLLPIVIFYFLLSKEFLLSNFQKTVLIFSSSIPFLSILLMIIGIPLNLEYGLQFKKSLELVKSEVDAHPEYQRIFVPSQFTFEVNQHKNARLIYPYYRVNHGKNPLKKDEMICVFEKSQINWVKKNFSNFDSLKIEELLVPSKGKWDRNSIKRIRPEYSQDSIGLWKITLEKGN